MNVHNVGLHVQNKASNHGEGFFLDKSQYQIIKEFCCFFPAGIQGEGDPLWQRAAKLFAAVNVLVIKKSRVGVWLVKVV